MFTRQQENIIIGLMLGDGHLSLKGRSKNASLHVRRKDTDAAYSQYHLQILKPFLTKKFQELQYRKTFDNRTNKYYYSVNFSSRSCQELTDIYYKWYHNKIKVIPRDLELNGEIIANWFCDDGWIQKSDTGYFNIGLATHGFLESDFLFLKNLLENRYNKNINVSQTTSNQFVLHLPNYVAVDMIRDMEPYFPTGMSRKKIWDINDLHNNSVSIKQSSNERKQIVKEFIENHDEFY